MVFGKQVLNNSCSRFLVYKLYLIYFFSESSNIPTTSLTCSVCNQTFIDTNLYIIHMWNHNQPGSLSSDSNQPDDLYTESSENNQPSSLYTESSESNQSTGMYTKSPENNQPSGLYIESPESNQPNDVYLQQNVAVPEIKIETSDNEQGI